MKILLPVVDPILILRLRSLNRGCSHIHTPAADLIQSSLDSCQHLYIVLIRLQIKADLRNSIICRSFRKNIHEHLGFILLRKWNLILNLDAFDSRIHHHAADQIFCLGRCCQRIFIPFHGYSSCFPYLSRLHIITQTLLNVQEYNRSVPSCCVPRQSHQLPPAHLPAQIPWHFPDTECEIQPLLPHRVSGLQP